MPRWESVLAAELSARHHVTTRARLERLGFSRRVIDGLCNRGRLVHVGNGVLISAAGPPTFERRLAIACALTRGVISYPTAGKVWDFRKTPRRGYPAFVTFRWVRSSRRRARWPRKWVVAGRAQGQSTLTAQTGHIWPVCGGSSTRVIAEASPAGLVSPAYGYLLAQLTNPWHSRPGTRFQSMQPRRRGFPPLTREHPVEIAPGRVIHPELGVPEHGFFVEVDHLSWHGGRLEGAYDRRRDLKVRAATGFCVERVTDIAIDKHLVETIEDLWAVWQQARCRR
jgi:hypothetical protein